MGIPLSERFYDSDSDDLSFQTSSGASFTPLRFVNTREIRSAAVLTSIQSAQLQMAGERYDGLELTAGERLGAGQDVDEEASFLGFCYLHEVVMAVPGEDEVDGSVSSTDVVFDCWTYNVDSGTFFRHGTCEVVADVIQCGVECSNNGRYPDNLAELLQEAYDRMEREQSLNAAPVAHEPVGALAAVDRTVVVVDLR